jgi:hypothetical protein
VGWLGINQGTKMQAGFHSRYPDLTSRFVRRLSTSKITFAQAVNKADNICESM